MSETKDIPNNGGQAFPRPLVEGMTLRDYFAAQALTGLMSDSGLRPSAESEFQHLAKRMYQIADAMLVERAK